LKPHDPLGDPSGGLHIRQAVEPFPKNGGLAHFDHL
jgi:hypothetical protein